MPNSTFADRPAKPSPDFPLFAPCNGKRAKTVAGKFVYERAHDPHAKAWTDTDACGELIGH